MQAMPEPFDEDGEPDYYLGEEPLPYIALPLARDYAERALVGLPGPSRVAPDREEMFRRFWRFIEEQAEAHRGDRDLENLLQIELFEGIQWTEDVLSYLGPRTRYLLRDAQHWLAPYNHYVGRRTRSPGPSLDEIAHRSPPTRATSKKRKNTSRDRGPRGRRGS
jgi:hypothetical protein